MIIRIMYSGENKREEIRFEQISGSFPQLQDIYYYRYVVTIPGKAPVVMQDWIDKENIELALPVLDWGKDPILFKADDSLVALMLLIHC